MSKRLNAAQREMLHYIRGYPDWIAEINTIADTRQAITYDDDKVQTSPEDKMLELALRMDELYDKVSKVEASLTAVYPDEIRQDARMCFCYGKRSEFREKHKSKFYKYRRAFANNLLRVFRRDIDES
jgi:hypothetical protein